MPLKSPPFSYGERRGHTFCSGTLTADIDTNLLVMKVYFQYFNLLGMIFAIGLSILMILHEPLFVGIAAFLFAVIGTIMGTKWECKDYENFWNRVKNLSAPVE